MRAVIFSLFLGLVSQFAHAGVGNVLSLKSDKAVYAVGENAVLRARFSTRPDNSDFQFDLVGTLNGQPLAVDRATDFDMFSTARALEAGEYTWTVQVVIQDARYARDLKSSIASFAAEIQRLIDLIAVEEDPVRLENLQNQKTRNESLKAAAEQELAENRTPILAPLSIQFIVQ